MAMTMVDFSAAQPEKQASFATVTSGLNYKFQAQLKGIDLILEAATALPNAHFIIIGIGKGQIPLSAPSNIDFIEPCSPSELRVHLNKTQFYLQLSLAEGFQMHSAKPCFVSAFRSALPYFPFLKLSGIPVMYFRNDRLPVW